MQLRTHLQWDVDVFFPYSYMKTREVGELQSLTVLLHEVLLNCAVLAIQRKPRSKHRVFRFHNHIMDFSHQYSRQL